MTTFRACVVALALLILPAADGSAHHSFAAQYDGRRTVTIQGVVKEFRFVNPHAMVTVDVTDETGRVVQWLVELAGRLNLGDVGWTADSVKIGERITVTGNPTHTASPRIFFRTIVRPDGTELLSANDKRQDAVEEDRRRRARQRDQQK